MRYVTFKVVFSPVVSDVWLWFVTSLAANQINDVINNLLEPHSIRICQFCV